MENVTFLMVGGFLGAGKTTLLLKLAKWLVDDQGLKVGLITNDQAPGLVDTVLARSAGFATQEIAGGCFCCRSDSLIEATERLTLSNQPDVFLAEPVGSCTDLIATVTIPLAQVYKKQYRISPLSVVLDPFRAAKVFSENTAARGSGMEDNADVNYIYRKQLEEAEIIVINKCDVVREDRLVALKERLSSIYPAAHIVCVSARSGLGLIEWWERLFDTTSKPPRLMQVDYDRYALGEAALGWVNIRYRLTGDAGFRPETLLTNICDLIMRRFREFGIEVAHFKASIQPVPGAEQAIVNQNNFGPHVTIQWVRSDAMPELVSTIEDGIHNGVMTVNLRAIGAPELINDIVGAAVIAASEQISAVVIEQAAFRPAPPKPQHRALHLAGTV